MKDYRDDHSPDIALLLTVAQSVRDMLVVLGGPPDRIKAIDDCLRAVDLSKSRCFYCGSRTQSDLKQESGHHG